MLRCSLAVFALIVAGASAFPKGYMYYKPGTPGIMYVQYEKPGIGSRANAVSAFVAGGAGDAMSFVDDMHKSEDRTVKQQFNANTINGGILVAEPAPSLEYLSPITENPTYNDFTDETDLLTRTENIADEMSVFQDDITTDTILGDGSIFRNAERAEESKGFTVYGVPDHREVHLAEHGIGEDTLGEGTVGDDTLEEHTVGEDTIGEGTVGEGTLEEHTIGEHTVGEDTIGEDTIGEHTIGEDTIREVQIGKDTIGEVQIEEDTQGEVHVGEDTLGKVNNVFVTTDSSISESDYNEVKENTEEILKTDSLEDKNRGFEVYGVPDNEETEIQAKRIGKDIFVDKVSQTNYVRKTTKSHRQSDESVGDTKSIDSVAADNDSTFAVHELNPSINVITSTESAPESFIVPSTKKTLRSSSRKPIYTPKKKAVYVDLDKEDEEVSLPRSYQVAELEEEEQEVGEDEGQLPFGKTFFPINFGVNTGGAIAIANSFSTGKGGSSQSHAIAYGSPSDASRPRQAARTSKAADCNC